MDRRAARKHRHELRRYRVRFEKRKRKASRRTSTGRLVYKSCRRMQLR